MTAVVDTASEANLSEAALLTVQTHAIEEGLFATTCSDDAPALGLVRPLGMPTATVSNTRPADVLQLDAAPFGFGRVAAKARGVPLSPPLPAQAPQPPPPLPEPPVALEPPTASLAPMEPAPEPQVPELTACAPVAAERAGLTRSGPTGFACQLSSPAPIMQPAALSLPCQLSASVPVMQPAAHASTGLHADADDLFNPEDPLTFQIDYNSGELFAVVDDSPAPNDEGLGLFDSSLVGALPTPSFPVPRPSGGSSPRLRRCIRSPVYSPSHSPRARSSEAVRAHSDTPRAGPLRGCVPRTAASQSVLASSSNRSWNRIAQVSSSASIGHSRFLGPTTFHVPMSMPLAEGEDEPPVCPDEDSALVERIRPLQHVQPTPQHGDLHRWRGHGKALDIDDPDGAGWCGSVATERSDGPRPPLTGPRTLLRGGVAAGSMETAAHSMHGGQGVRLQHARQQLHTALQALATCDAQICGHIEDTRRRDVDAQTKKEVAALVAELGELRAEASQLRREVQRLKGAPEELTALPTSVLHTLQQELSQSLRNVHYELESRTKCCVCREVERQVLLRPCQHLALCNACARRVDKCPLCRRGIDRYEVVCVA